MSLVWTSTSKLEISQKTEKHKSERLPTKMSQTMVQSITSPGVKSQGRGRTNSLASTVVDYLKAWIMSPEHINHPYPTEKEKAEILDDTGIDLKRLNNWFVNNRIRYWKPKMDAIQKKQEQSTKSVAATPSEVLRPSRPESVAAPASQIQAPLQMRPELPAQLVSSLVSFGASSPVSPISVPCVSEGSTSADSSVASICDGDSSDDNSFQDNDNRKVVTKPKDTCFLTNSQVKRSQIRSSPKRKRQEETLQTPRTKYRRSSFDLWRESCEFSKGQHDEDLPTLDEATLLFGYASEY